MVGIGGMGSLPGTLLGSFIVGQVYAFGIMFKPELALGFLIAPAVLSEFYLTVLCEAFVMSLLALSFNLLFGYMGQLSFGQAAFYGLGGYTVAMLTTKVQFNFGLSILAGIFVAGTIGLIVGYFCVRLRGIYFAILTLAFGQLLFCIIFKWQGFTGGDDGIQGVFPPDLLKSISAYYYFILLVIIASAFIIWRIIQSPFGQTIKAMRENSERTEFLGINIAKYQLITFVIAAAFAGLAGAIWVPFYRSVAPSYLMWIKSGEPVMAAIQANTLGDSISHDDKKRLELAITLGTEPEILLLDEPTCGMSPEETESTMIFIKKLAEERGLTILFTEHDMSVVFGIAKRISVLHQGTLIADGSPQEVRASEEVQKVYLGGTA
ncbi:MAG: branched-chain amino acid ABC transporter permease [Thermodesulfobacteriota bacterium]|nr:branched-chain amino acid ABC transporter permease [Thermodesulfobacteriota bacterium]